MSPIGDTRHCWNCSRQRCTDQLCRLWRWSCVHNGVIQRGVVGNDVSSGGIRTGARKGNSFGAPTRWRDTFLGWGCTDECLPFYLPFRSIPFFVFLSLSGSRFHQLPRLPATLPANVFRGTKFAMETWSRLLSILSHERASNGSISIEYGDILVKWD